MNISKRIIVSFLVMISLALMLTTLSACENEKSSIELKLYDENWVELEKEKGDVYLGYKRSYEIEYDGEPKGFNAIIYINGSVLIRYDYTGKKIIMRQD